MYHYVEYSHKYQKKRPCASSKSSLAPPAAPRRSPTPSPRAGKTIDLADPEKDFSTCAVDEDDQVLIALPSFGGRVPTIATERLSRIAGNGAACTLICVYGNRAFEDTLAEMEDTARACGFNVVAAVAAVAEHSIFPQFATGRPDAADAAQLRGFARHIVEEATDTPTIPGNRPYKQGGRGSLVPQPTGTCVGCGLCARECPAQAIDAGGYAADPETCIGCMRCPRICPVNAREVNAAAVAAKAEVLSPACTPRKENELFL